MSRTLASNPSTPPTTLEALAADANWSVRCAVAGNPNTPTWGSIAHAQVTLS